MTDPFRMLVAALLVAVLTSHSPQVHAGPEVSAGSAPTQPVSNKSATAPAVAAAPSLEELRTRFDAWVAPRLDESPGLREALTSVWSEATVSSTDLSAPPAPLSAAKRSELLMRALYLADTDVRNLIEQCRYGSDDLTHRDFPALVSHRDEPLYHNNVRAFYGRFLATATLYEEALDQLNGIDLTQLADPATVLFYQAVCQHALLQKTEGLATLKQLLDATENVPVRYRTLAELMQSDLEKLENKTLGEVARQMSDVQRRLSLGRAGQKVQKVEDDIIATLDELIKKEEDEQNNSGGGAGAAGQMQPGQSQGAEDAYLGGIKGQGLTDRKDIGHKDNWGALPEKQQAAAKGMLENQFPGHYRLAVEQYLKRLAERTAPPR